MRPKIAHTRWDSDPRLKSYKPCGQRSMEQRYFQIHYLGQCLWWYGYFVQHDILCIQPVTSNHGPRTIFITVRFLARKAEWSAHKNFTSVLFSWSHQATGPVQLGTAVHLWFGRMIRRTPWVPCTVPVRASLGPRKGIFNVFNILLDPHGAHAGPARVTYDTLTDTEGN